MEVTEEQKVPEPPVSQLMMQQNESNPETILDQMQTSRENLRKPVDPLIIGQTLSSEGSARAAGKSSVDYHY